MPATDTSLAMELRHDFQRARAQLAGARLDQAEKDTPAHRAAVGERLALIDTILDMYLQVSSQRP